MDRLRDEIEDFDLHSFADLVVLARVASEVLSSGGQLSDGTPKLIIDHIIRLANQRSA